MSRTLIRNASWVVAWDEAAGRHRYLRDADIAFEDGQIIHVGSAWTGGADRIIDGAGLMAMPGLVNVHGHIGTEALAKGFFEELGSPLLYMSRLYEFLYVVRPEPQAIPAGTRLSIAELLLSGCTTVADMALPYEGWLDTIADTGIRGYVAPMFRSAAWQTVNGHRVEYQWDEAGGERGMQRAIEVCLAARRHPSGRMGGIVMPAQAETCTPELLQAAYKAAKQHRLPFQTHLCQSVHEFHEMIRRHGLTPVGYLNKLGVLDANTSIAHGIFLDHHPWLHWPQQEDLQILAKAGVTVIHSPHTFAYRGAALHHFGKYVQAGVPMAMGTDTTPHNMLDEMRLALFAAKMQSGHVNLASVSDVLHAATIGGARSLGRDDIGRLAPAAKADIVLVDLSHPAMVPNRDPLRGLIFNAGSRAVRDVFVDGRQVVEGGKVLTIDVDAACRIVEEGQLQAMANVPKRDAAGRSADEIAPLSLEMA
ncbi:amidohydrolase family protein [uncultured Ferrovibrio sp.]|jgi:Cytosine deaminase and related metal-dependent hydrolases|uniref:amidohydrolase family protein n=1 Tax=uncultured Ferrovibrio sp. TaxID=1576913 RepID=UPI00263147FB|nr:amidohydrolase family protein [uncultured Ferrovibrio sp.]